MLGDSQRGYHLEILISKLAVLKEKSQIARSLTNKTTERNIAGPPTVSGLSFQLVALSATIPNLSTLADWFEAEVFTTQHRPVPLREMVAAGDSIYDSTGQLVRCVSNDSQPIGHLTESSMVVTLCVEGLRRGQQIIIFCSSRNVCESTVRMLRTDLLQKTVSPDSSSLDSSNESQEPLRHCNCPLSANEVVADRQRAVDKLRGYYQDCGYSLTKSQETLLEGVSGGLAFHHAGVCAVRDTYQVYRISFIPRYY